LLRRAARRVYLTGTAWYLSGGEDFKNRMGAGLVRKSLNMIKGLQDGQDKDSEKDETSRIDYKNLVNPGIK